MILVTGGAGYIGSHINKLLNNSGYETVILDNLSKGHKSAVRWGELVNADLSDSDKQQYHYRNFIRNTKSFVNSISIYYNSLAKDFGDYPQKPVKLF